MVNVPAGLQITNGSSQRRVPRRPTHSFNLRHKPWQIQPFLLAPVLAGETFKNALLQSRVVTDPIRNPLIGWHIEYYLFYVKLRDLTARDTFENMLLDMTTSLSGVTDAVASAPYYHYSGMNWAKLCLERVTDEFFRDEGETWNTESVDGVPMAQISGKSWLDSVYGNAEVPDDTIDQTPTADISLQDFEGKWNTWMYMRGQKMTEMSFEDYLGTFGVKQANNEPHKPELLRYMKEWSYPTNTIDPLTGNPTSAVSWSVSERADKDRFFTEPGFVFGVTVARPKVYMGGQREHASHLLDNALSWLPAVMKDKVETSLKEVAQSTGPLGGVHTGASYWVDVRDLFVHGDQFINYSAATTDDGVVVDLPTTTNAASRYPDADDIADLFVEPEGEDPARLHVRQDGVVSLNILGTQMDHT